MHNLCHERVSLSPFASAWIICIMSMSVMWKHISSPVVVMGMCKKVHIIVAVVEHNWVCPSALSGVYEDDEVCL